MVISPKQGGVERSAYYRRDFPAEKRIIQHSIEKGEFEEPEPLMARSARIMEEKPGFDTLAVWGI
jgi:hypothetical protein